MEVKHMAYNRTYQYETSPRKIEPEYEQIKQVYTKKSTARRMSRKEENKKKREFQRKVMLYIVICFTALFIISCRYSAIDDTHAKLKKEEEKLALIEKETTQLEAGLETSLNLTTIEQEAKDKLGMQKRTPEQMVYVSLPKTDHIESSSEQVKSSDFEQNWLMKIINKITQNFK